jgi:hypothetical protein
MQLSRHLPMTDRKPIDTDKNRPCGPVRRLERIKNNSYPPCKSPAVMRRSLNTVVGKAQWVIAGSRGVEWA